MTTLKRVLAWVALVAIVLLSAVSIFGSIISFLTIQPVSGGWISEIFTTFSANELLALEIMAILYVVIGTTLVLHETGILPDIEI